MASQSELNFLAKDTLFATDIPCVFVLPKTDKARMPQMIIGRPFRELEVSLVEAGASGPHSFILAAVNPLPQCPLFCSGKFANGQVPVCKLRNRRKSCCRSDGVNPFLVRAT